MTRTTLLERAGAAALSIAGVHGLGAGAATAGGIPGASAYRAEVPAAWFDLALELVKATPGFSPPVASRAFAYSGIALDEALAPGTPGRDGFAGRVNGLTHNRPPDDGAYHWPTVANYALATILRRLFPTAPPVQTTAIEQLERRFGDDAQAVLPRGRYARSVARGQEVAEHVFDWSKTDGGHEGFRNNFPPYTEPTGPGAWVRTPPGFSPPLQPYWGANRPFAPSSDHLPDPGPPPVYSEATGSAFSTEATECYRVSRALDAEQAAIARFWSDEPGVTATPAGHSVSILTQIVRQLDLPLGRAADAYARVGIAVADSFIACWRTKYRYNLLRPVTYVRRVLDPGWTPLLATPPFPEYTSGHSVQSAAAAAVLTGLFGDVAFTDRTHESRGLPARSFPSFEAAAEEAGISRLYGGIHFRSAIERGLEQGRSIGRRALAI
jgi:hypothetical protein